MKILFNGNLRSFKQLILRGDGWGYAQIRHEDKYCWFVIRNTISEYWEVTRECDAISYFNLATFNAWAIDRHPLSPCRNTTTDMEPNDEGETS